MFIRGNRRLFVLIAAYLTGFIAAPLAHAQFAVIDVTAVTQLITQVQTLQQQLETARNQLLQAQAQLQSMTGQRGMEDLLVGQPRNYLPSDWAALESVLRSEDASGAELSDIVREAIAANAVLSTERLDAMPARERALIDAARESTALLEMLTQEALVSTSSRFAAIQQLIDTIARADDQKAILDLQARIGAEQGMLQNEQTKLQVLYQAAQAHEWADRQRLREEVVAGHGRFVARFQPRL